MPAVVLMLAVLTAMLASPILPAWAISHPHAYVYGTVTKEIMFGQAWQRWEDAEGIDHYLPFEALDGSNFTLDVWDIHFSPQMVNDSFTFHGTASDEFNKKIDSYAMNYWYMRNYLDNQASSGETAYATAECQEPVGSNTYIFGAVKLQDMRDASRVLTGIKIAMSSSTMTYYMQFLLDTSAASLSTSWGSNIATIYYPAQVGTTWVFQFNIERTFNAISGLDVDIDSVDEIRLVTTVYNNTAATGEYAVSIFRFCIITQSMVYINNAEYVVNSTTVTIPATNDVLNVYGYNASYCYDFTAHFIYSDTDYDITLHPDDLKISYTWEFQLPDDSNAGSFSDTGLNFTLNKSPEDVDFIYVNGVDYKGSLAGHEAGDTITLVTGLTPGTIYRVWARICYTADEYDALTGAPAFWVNPIGWLAYHFWELIAAIASFLGLAGVAMGARRRARRYRMPVR